MIYEDQNNAYWYLFHWEVLLLTQQNHNLCATKYWIQNNSFLTGHSMYTSTEWEATANTTPGNGKDTKWHLQK